MQGRKPDEDIRLPMQWSNKANAGFTTGIPWRALDVNFTNLNVSQQMNDPDSLLKQYQTLIELRDQYPALRTGGTILLETGNSGIYAIIRSDGDENLLVLVNLKDNYISDYGLRLDEGILPDGEVTPETLFGSGGSSQINIVDGKFSEYKPLNELPPYTAFLFLLR